MSHLVIFRGEGGKTSYHQSETLDEAVKFVEHLRNQENVEDARLFRLDEVPLEVRTYYKVEVSAAGPAASGPVRAESALDDERTVVDPLTGEPLPAGVAAANRFGLFNRN